MLDLDALVLGPCMTAFGEPVRFVGADGLAGGTAGIFNENHVELHFDGDQETRLVRPLLGLRLSTLPRTPREGDLFVIRGGTWAVREVLADGVGHAKVYLNGPL